MFLHTHAFFSTDSFKEGKREKERVHQSKHIDKNDERGFFCNNSQYPSYNFFTHILYSTVSRRFYKSIRETDRERDRERE